MSIAVCQYSTRAVIPSNLFAEHLDPAPDQLRFPAAAPRDEIRSQHDLVEDSKIVAPEYMFSFRLKN